MYLYKSQRTTPHPGIKRAMIDTLGNAAYDAVEEDPWLMTEMDIDQFPLRARITL